VIRPEVYQTSHDSCGPGLSAKMGTTVFLLKYFAHTTVTLHALNARHPGGSPGLTH